MKLASKWIQEFPTDEHCQTVPARETMLFIRAIQADALRRAADLANEEVSTWEGFASGVDAPQDYYNKLADACESVRKKIAAEAAKLEERTPA